MGSDKLKKAFLLKNDEFYTQLNDVENELTQFLPLLRGKRVLLPCDGDDSSFTIFFKYYAKQYGYKLTYSAYFKSKGKVWSDYDFNDYDFLFTNPPFSQYRQMFSAIVKTDIKFCIVGNFISFVYSKIFPYFKSKKVWFGSVINKFIDIEGNYKNVLANWYTNIPNYCPKKEFKWFSNNGCYENVYTDDGVYIDNIVNVNKIRDIPWGLTTPMLVPITFFTYNYEPYFKLIRLSKSHDYNIIKDGRLFGVFHRFKVIRI